MTDRFEITPDWQESAQGSPEDRASFALLGIRWGDTWLTEAEDAFVSSLRQSVPVSAYRLAEWLTWNWHRLRWEPRTKAPDWSHAHRMSTIGGGYVWPNITIYSDGERVVWLTQPTTKSPAEPLRYTSNVAAIIGAATFEASVDKFIREVLTRLNTKGVNETNLKTLWEDLSSERKNSDSRKRRRLEALLGFDPDECDPALLERLVLETQDLGEKAVFELAADHGNKGEVPTASELRTLAMSRGVHQNPADIVRLNSNVGIPAYGSVPAWRRGAAAAKALRAQERVGDGRIADAVLAGMFGVQTPALSYHSEKQDLSFAMQEPSNERVVLRPKHPSGRRFELARLIGDRLIATSQERLSPATEAYTYRQKQQRSFAAELLCPIDSLDDFLRGDFSEDRILDAASNFEVSEWMVRTLLMNHRRTPKADLENDFDAAA